MASTSVSRRVALGAGALGAVGAASVAVGQTNRGRRWLHAAGVLDSPDTPMPEIAGIDAMVTAATIPSDHEPSDVPYSLYSPGDEAEAILVCLHGRNEDHTFAFDKIGVHRFVAARKLAWAVVAPNGGDASYWHDRTDGRNPQSMVFDELLPHVFQLVGEAPVLMLGWSMGGYGALLAAAERPDSVTAVAAASPALWRSAGQTPDGAFDSDDDFQAHNLFAPAHLDALRSLPVRIDCGDDDPFAAADRELVAELPDARHDFGAGFHDAPYWRSRVRTQLDFFTQALP